MKKQITLFGLVVILSFCLIICSCGSGTVLSGYSEDEVAIGQYLAKFKPGQVFTIHRLEKAEYQENTVFYNVVGSTAIPNETIDAYLLIEYNKGTTQINLHYWEALRAQPSSAIRNLWENKDTELHGYSEYSEEQIAALSEKAAEVAQLFRK